MKIKLPMKKKIISLLLAVAMVLGMIPTAIISQTAKGVSDVTIRNYHSHLRGITKHLDVEMQMVCFCRWFNCLRRKLESKTGPFELHESIGFFCHRIEK